MEKTKNYYLISNSLDWKDEFDVFFFIIMDEDTYKRYMYLKKVLGSYNGEFYFGTNEGWDGDFDYLQFDPKPISINNLEVFNKKDSTDVCFISDTFNKYISGIIKKEPGDVIYVVTNKVIAKHDGLSKYTIGQRKGLGISNPVPLFVIGFDEKKNEVIVGEEKEIYTKEFLVNDINLILMDKIDGELEVDVKTRYTANSARAKICQVGNEIKVVFEAPQRAITPGQSAVFYINDVVIGGGKIV